MRYAGICFCGHIGVLTKHHPLPMSTKKNKKTIMICNNCHTLIHKYLTIDELTNMTATEQVNWLIDKLK